MRVSPAVRGHSGGYLTLKEMHALLSQYSEFFAFAACWVVAIGIHGVWLWRKRRTKSPWQVWILGVCILFASWYVSGDAGKRERDRIESMTGEFARLYGYEMQQSGHARLPGDAAADDSLYLSLIKMEKRWLTLNASISDIYTLRKRPDGKNVFLVDSETDYDHNGKYEGDREQRTPVGDVYDEADPALERAFLGEASFAFEPITDRWGTWVSAFVPLLAPDGRVEGVLGVDFDAKSFQGLIASAKWRVLALMGLIQIVLLGSSTATSLLRTQVMERDRAYAVLRESEERFSGAFEHAPIGVALVLTDGRWLKVNRALCELLGYSETELLTHDFQSVTHPGELDACRTNVLQLIGGEIGPFLMEKRYVHKNGHFVTTLTSVSLVRDNEGLPLHLVAQIQDITARKQAEEDLRWKTALLQAQVRSSLDGIIVVDQKGRNILQNQRVADLFKIPRHIAGDVDDSAQVRWVTEATKNPTEFIERVRHLYAHPNEIGRDEIELKDGTVMDRYSSPVVGGDGKHYGRIWSFRDITESKRAATALAESQRFLQSTLNALSSHIAILDERGTIVEVNAAWNGFAAENDLPRGHRGMGDNYLQLCDDSVGKFSEEASSVAAGIRAVMAGQCREFHLEYPCHSPTEQRWFIVRVTRFGGDGPVRIVVAHENISERKKAEVALLESEERFRGTFEQAAVGIAHVSTNGHFLRVNDKLCSIFGFERQNLLNMTFADLTVPEDLAAGTAAERAMLAGEQSSYTAEKRYRRRNGDVVWINLVTTLERTESGTPKYFISVLEDISARKLTEKALRESQHFAESIAENSTSIIYLFELATGKTIYSNRNVAEFLGYTQEQIAALGGTILPKIMHPEDLPLIAQQHKEYAEVMDSRVFDLEFRLKNAAGEWRWIWARETVFKRRPDGVPWQILGTAHDVTERKDAEVALAKVHRELVDASRRAGMAEVATGVIHNVGNVLNSVNVAATCVADSIRHSKLKSLDRTVAMLREHNQDLPGFFSSDPRGAQLPDFLEQLAARLAGEQATALTELGTLQKNIEHIKDIVAMQQSYGKISGASEKLDLADIVEDTLRLSADTLTRHHVQVVRDFAAVPLVMADKHKLLQILVNLVSNAKHACEAADRSDRRLTVRVFNGDGRVKVSVSDNGVGIPQENLIRIFNHGFTTKRKGHGFGLHSGALAAQEMGGSLNVHSDGAGKGSTFTLALPLEPSGASERSTINPSPTS